MTQDPTKSQPVVERVKLWDPILRFFHWALVVCVVIAWYLGRFGPDIMTLHFYFGYAVIALLVLRVGLGLLGPPSARFSGLFHSPSVLVRYMKNMFARKPSYWPGHNPVGSLAAIALLLTLMLQVATGLFSDPDDYVNVGPFASYIDAATTRLVTGWHYYLSLVLLGLVGLHLLAIGFYKIWKHEDLVRPMITGWKEVVRSDQK
ncbi:MAG: cytochrome b/b6 domain-containing protein [Cohaesibacter sp.]|jgi:cytochrome b|nr:cytochrome b/b6 domain-containing protein [Cohaesibacter sp.]